MPDPQCFPTKVANAWRADEVRVRLCFLVKVRKARGRSVAGGRRMGRTVDLAAGRSAGGARIAVVLRGSMGWTGVPKAGEDEGTGLAGTENGFSARLEVDMAAVCESASFGLHPHFATRASRQSRVAMSSRASAGTFLPHARPCEA